MDREYFGGVSAASGKLTGENEDVMVAAEVDGSHWASTLRARATRVSCTTDNCDSPRLNEPASHRSHANK